jgi:hypothetical protein
MSHIATGSFAMSKSPTNRVSFAGRTISFQTAVHLIADARRESIGKCARMLGMSREDLVRFKRGQWNLSRDVIGATEGLLSSTFGTFR